MGKAAEFVSSIFYDQSCRKQTAIKMIYRNAVGTSQLSHFIVGKNGE